MQTLTARPRWPKLDRMLLTALAALLLLDSLARAADTCATSVEKFLAEHADATLPTLKPADRTRLFAMIRNQAELVLGEPVRESKAPLFVHARMRGAYSSESGKAQVDLIANVQAIVLAFKIKRPGEAVRYRCIAELE